MRGRGQTNPSSHPKPPPPPTCLPSKFPQDLLFLKINSCTAFSSGRPPVPKLPNVGALHIWLWERGHDAWMGRCQHIPHLAHSWRVGEGYGAYCKSGWAIRFSNLVGVAHVLVHQGIHGWEVPWSPQDHQMGKDDSIKEDGLPMPPYYQTVSRHWQDPWEVQRGEWSHNWQWESLLYQIVRHN